MTTGALVYAIVRKPIREHSRRLFAFGLLMTGAGWAMMWGTEWRLNPLSFTVMWTGAAVAMWTSSREGYPGLKRHLALAVMSAPIWWWFELINVRVDNWAYDYKFEYGRAEWALLSTLAFATVIPAVTAAFSLLRSYMNIELAPEEDGARKRFARREMALAVVLQAATIAFPTQLYPLVWVAPFLAVDGLIGFLGGRSLASDLAKGRWRLAAAMAAAGLLCGLLWEFWNYYATPKWEYHIPLLGFAKVFEMPVLGYGGYVPFAWSIVQLVRLMELVWDRATGRENSPGDHDAREEPSRLP